MRTLALELSSAQGSIALLDGEQRLFVSEWANDRKDSGPFFEHLQGCLQKFDNPERIVVGLGPGSYAGTRIAIAAAIGLQAATGAALIGLPSLCAMPTTASKYMVVGDARRESFFFALVEERRCIEGPLLCTSEELTERLETLDCPVFAAEPLPNFPTVVLIYPSAILLAQLATATSISIAPLEPIYLREPHITSPAGPK